jgi:hypothetical protein
VKLPLYSYVPYRGLCTNAGTAFYGLKASPPPAESRRHQPARPVHPCVCRRRYIPNRCPARPQSSLLQSLNRKAEEMCDLGTANGVPVSCRSELLAIWSVCAGNGHGRAQAFMVARAHAGKSTAAYNERGINIIDVRMEARNPVTREWRHCSHGKELEWMCRTVSREKDWPTKCAPTREKMCH